MGEAILSLRIDWWKDRFAVNLQSSPQGLPDLLCVCNEITRLPDGPLGSKPECEPGIAAHWGEAGHGGTHQQTQHSVVEIRV